jgi:transcriptional regulator MraZ
MAAFRGSYTHAIDHKGRVSIPAKFRRQLSGDANETFVVVRGMDTCIAVYPADEFRHLDERLRARSYADESNRRLQRMMLNESSDETLDAQGRVSLPPSLIAHAQLTKEVKIVGLLDHLELWNPELFQKYIESSPKTYEEIAGELLP